MNKTATVSALLAFLIITSPLFAQDGGSNEDTDLYSEETVKVDKSKSEIYLALNVWVSENVENKEKSVQLDDKELGKLIADVPIKVNVPSSACGEGGTEIKFVLNMKHDFSIKDSTYKVVQTFEKMRTINPFGEDNVSEKLSMKECAIEPIKPQIDKMRASIKDKVREYDSGF